MLILLKKKAMMGEKISGIKLHTGVDVLGLPHAIMVTTVDVTDRSGAIDMVDYYCDVTNYLSMLKKILADEGYTGENFSNSVKALSGANVEIVKRNFCCTAKTLDRGEVFRLA